MKNVDNIGTCSGYVEVRSHTCSPLCKMATHAHTQRGCIFIMNEIHYVPSPSWHLFDLSQHHEELSLLSDDWSLLSHNKKDGPALRK